MVPDTSKLHCLRISDKAGPRGYPMNLFDVRLRFVAYALAVLSLCTCVVNGESSVSSPAPSEGTISVFSSIEGSTRASECDYVGATDLELAIYQGSTQIATVTSSCYDFQLTVALPNGYYDADATLLDSHSQPVSTTLPLHDLQAIFGTDLQVDIDFPISSILL